jgi:hypothetical protein
MKTWPWASLIASIAGVAWGGLAFTVDNDFFVGSDSSSYTHGAELTWYDQNDWGTYFTGLRNRIYTPTDTTRAENQPDDHPWCGLSTVFFEQGITQGRLRSKYSIETGILGPSSMAKEQQIWFHKLSGSDKPQGWNNQLQNEFALNAYLDNWYGLGPQGRTQAWSVTPDFLYGGVLGTVYDHLYSGLGVRAGYNIPPLWPDNGLSPDVPPRSPPFFAYLLASLKGIAVAHNATLGQSLFHGVDEEHHVDPHPFLGEARVGICLGYGWVSLMGLVSLGTREFDGQDDTPAWGEVRLTVGRPF